MAESTTTTTATDRFCFLVEWFDVHAQLTRNYQLFFCPVDQTVEMFDTKSHKTFLKRTRAVEGLSLSDFYIGSAVNIYSRQLFVVGFGDLFTTRSLADRTEQTCLIVGPTAGPALGEIIDQVVHAGFTLAGVRMLFDESLRGTALNNCASGQPKSRSIALKLNKDNAVAGLVKLAATPQNGVLCKYASNGLHMSQSTQQAHDELAVVFGSDAAKKLPRTAQYTRSTLAIIRPHIYNAGHCGRVIDAITKGGFEITDMENFHLDSANAEEFLEVYKDVIPEYHAILDQLTAGQLIVMEIGGKRGNIVQEFREFCGPSDPELAQKLRPNSLRAKFGIDKIKNGLHCTDLPDDGELEVEYFFKILVS